MRATLAAAEALSNRQKFFHWPLEFPEVFTEGGFDVVLSNPPWERVKLQEQEFFAARDARIATAPNKAARAKLIRDLPNSNPSLYDEFAAALRASSAASTFMRQGGRYPLTGRGDINTYAIFAEMATDRKNERTSGIIGSDRNRNRRNHEAVFRFARQGRAVGGPGWI